jgi:hypothetical protein
MLLSQGRYRAETGNSSVIILLCILSLIFVGCSSGPNTDGNDSFGTAGFVDIEADAGILHTIEVGQTATLDGTDSTPQGTLSYKWSFNSKPDLSNAVLMNPNSESPSFVADVKGIYTIQLVVTSNGVVSPRDIALVEAVDTGERPAFLHINLASRCSNCHFEGSLNRAKSGDHVATTNLCQACHTTFGFELISFVDHKEVFGNCSDCHNNVIAVGKSRYHETTSLECDECHNTVSFLNLEPDGSYSHENISRPCQGCHDGVIAVGKDADHVQTDFACNRCHSTLSFAPAFFDHDAFDFSVTTCVSCHDNDPTIGKTVNHPATSDNCQVCHNTTTFNLNGNFNHDVIDDEVIQCVACHDGNHVAAGARGMTDTIIHTNATAGNVDCGNCHNTDDFAVNFVDHTSDAVTLVRCDSCHTGNPGEAIGVPSPNHVPLSGEDCDVCHTPGNFATGFYDHTTVEADLNVRCDSCHNEIITIGKFSTHVPTSQDCRVCHDTTTFNGATVDHSSIVGGCDTCHNGVAATGKVDAIPAHIPTTDDCSSCHTVNLPLAFSPSTFLTGVHTTIVSDCQSCHGTYATDKPRRTHIPTVDDCSNCHVTSSFAGGTFDHTGIDRGCEGCHNGRFTTASLTILGKPTALGAHVPTQQDCYFCHNTTDPWLTSGQTVFAHIGISGNCTSCHDGTYTAIGALPKTPTHPVTNADCGACHTTADVPPNGVSFLNYFIDHSNFQNNCGTAGCHDSATDEGIYALSTAHGPSNGNDCHLCHTAGVAWVPAIFDHSNVTQSTRCDSCHNGNNATGKDAKVNPAHIPTTQDCRQCHNTTSFAGATFDHQGITNNCGSCHNGDTATGKNNNHVPTNADCVECHQTTGFIPATFDHAGITNNCASCHDGVLATGKTDAPTPHIETNQDCGVCHTIGDTFVGGIFDHSGITNNCARSGCHGSGATGKPQTHVPTTLDCSNCHTTATFVGASWFHDASTRGRCLDCHVTGGGATPQPPSPGHFATGPGVQCDACHTTDTWADQGTFDHCPNTNANNNRCGDYPGDHRIGKASCRDCHRSNSATPVTYPDQAQYAPFCAGCHAGDFRREGDHIGGSNGTVQQNRDCGQSGCHRVSSNGW